MTTSSRPADRPLAGYDAVVWDLDGTLVDLVVDWAAVTHDVALVFEEAGIDATDDNLWDLLERADESGLRDDVETVIGGHEHRGAERSNRLPHADVVGEFAVEGVCSLNCERACRTALEVHDLTAHVDAVVGRDTLSTYKPDPEPLWETISRMGVDRDETVFIGDSVRDEEAAERADIAFRYVEDVLGLVNGSSVGER